MRRGLPMLILLPVVALAFIAGMVRLFGMRFDSGDIYPAYSSLRCDPKGASALFDALSIMPGMEVGRDLESGPVWPDPADTTVFVLGDRTWNDAPGGLEEKKLYAFLLAGGRLVAAFNNEKGFLMKAMRPLENDEEDEEPTLEEADKGNQEEEKMEVGDLEQTEGGNTEKAGVDEDAEKGRVVFPAAESFQNVLGFSMGKSSETGSWAVECRGDMLPWRSGLNLNLKDKAWRIVGSQDGKAVIAERSFGAGSVVLASDSFFLSNECLNRAPALAVLSWLVDGRKHARFEEAHHGLRENRGIVSLAKRYGMEGFAVLGVVLALLYVWRNSVPFAPGVPGGRDGLGREVAGQGEDEAFVSLLTRTMAVKDLVPACFDAWKRSLQARERESMGPRMARIETMLQSREAQAEMAAAPETVYRRISRIIQER